MTHARDLAALARTTSSVAELNKLDGFTGVVADLNYAKDLKATGVTNTEFDHLDGVTSNLQTQLGVIDKSSLFTAANGFTGTTLKSYAFNGLMFVWFGGYFPSTPANGTTIWNISNTGGYRPVELTLFPTSSFEGDTAQFVKFNTDGTVQIESPLNLSNGALYLTVNGWYRYA
jgi:hypothetical protein